MVLVPVRKKKKKKKVVLRRRSARCWRCSPRGIIARAGQRGGRQDSPPGETRVVLLGDAGSDREKLVKRVFGGERRQLGGRGSALFGRKPSNENALHLLEVTDAHWSRARVNQLLSETAAAGSGPGPRVEGGLQFALWNFLGDAEVNSFLPVFLPARSAIFVLAFDAAQVSSGELSSEDGCAAVQRRLQTWVYALKAFTGGGVRVLVVGTHCASLASSRAVRGLLNDTVADVFEGTGLELLHGPENEQVLLLGDMTGKDTACHALAAAVARAAVESTSNVPPVKLRDLRDKLVSVSREAPLVTLLHFERILRGAVQGILGGKLGSCDGLVGVLRAWGWILVFSDEADQYVILDQNWLVQCLACMIQQISVRDAGASSRQELEAAWRKQGLANDPVSLKRLIVILRASGLAFGSRLGLDETRMDDVVVQESEVVVIPCLVSKRHDETGGISSKVETRIQEAPRSVRRQLSFAPFPAGLLACAFARFVDQPQSEVVGWQYGFSCFIPDLKTPIFYAFRAYLDLNYGLITVHASSGMAYERFELTLVEVLHQLSVRSNVVNAEGYAIYRDGIQLAFDPILGEVMTKSNDAGPFEFSGESDVMPGRVVGQGLYSKVVCARATGTNTKLPIGAVFAMKRSSAAENTDEQNYDRELQVMRQVGSCKYAVSAIAFEVSAFGDVCSLLMPLFDCSLVEVICERSNSKNHIGWFSPADVTPWLLDVCKGLAFLHGKGYAHLDVSPESILVTKKGIYTTVQSVAIGSFRSAVHVGGMSTQTGEPALPVNPTDDRQPLEMQRGMTKYSGYTAPELLQAREHSNGAPDLFAADIYSFGVLVSVCVSGLMCDEIGPNSLTPTVARGAGSSVRLPPVSDSADSADSDKWNNLRGLISQCVADDPTERPTFAALVEGGLELRHAEYVVSDVEKCKAREAIAKASAANTSDPASAHGEQVADAESLSARRGELSVLFRQELGLRTELASRRSKLVWGDPSQLPAFREPVEVVANRDLERGRLIAKRDSYSEVVQVRVIQGLANLPAGAIYSMKSPDSNFSRKTDTFDGEFEAMRNTSACEFIVNVVAYQQENLGITHLVMPICEADLQRVISGRKDEIWEKGWFDVAQVTSWLVQICYGMQFLHGKGYAHLNLRPDIVLVHTGGSYDTVTSVLVGGLSESILSRPLIAGFDFSQSFGPAAHTQYTKLTGRTGSRGFMAPEVLMASSGAAVVGDAMFAADIYSFGILASVCISGVSIGRFIGDEVWAPTEERGAGSSVRPPVNDSPDWDGLRGVVSQCVCGNPLLRPTSSHLAEIALRIPKDERVSANPDKCTAREPAALKKTVEDDNHAESLEHRMSSVQNELADAASVLRSQIGAMKSELTLLRQKDAEWQDILATAVAKNNGKLDWSSKGLHAGRILDWGKALHGNVVLKELYLQHNSEMGQAGLVALGTILSEIPALEKLSLFGCALTDLSLLVSAKSESSTAHDGDNNAAVDDRHSDEITSVGLSNLTHLNVGGNALSELPVQLLEVLPKLEWLSMSLNRCSDGLLLPTQIAKLPRHCKVLLYDCDGVMVARLRSKRLKQEARGDQGVVHLPPEYCTLGGVSVADIMAFSSFGGDIKHPNNVRLAIVGDAGVGKTTLAEALTGTRGPLGTAVRVLRGATNRTITFGIDVMEWRPEADGFDVAFMLWDFAGQPEYHPTHLMFLDKDTLYLVVFNAGAAAAGGAGGIEDALKYLETWISLIAARAPGARVIIVGTHGNAEALRPGSPTLLLLRQELQRFCASPRVAGVTVEVFSSLRTFAESSAVASSTQPLQRLRGVSRVGGTADTLASALARIPGEPATEGGEIVATSGSVRDRESFITVNALDVHDAPTRILADACVNAGSDMVRGRSKLPGELLMLQKFIQAAKKPVMSKDEFTKLLETELFRRGGTKIELSDPLLAALVSFGWICHFPQKAALTHLIFLSPQWLAKCLACVVERVDSKGRGDATVTRKELEAVWRAHMKKSLASIAVKALLDVMLNFDLASENTQASGTQSYVVPSLLPTMPPRISDSAASVLEKATLEFHYTFSRYASGFFSKLFVRLYRTPGVIISGWQGEILSSGQTTRPGFLLNVVVGSAQGVLRASLERSAIAVTASHMKLCDMLEHEMVHLSNDIGQNLFQGQESQSIAVMRDRITLQIDPLTGSVVTAHADPVEFVSAKDIEVGKDIAEGGFGKVVLARTTGDNPRLPRDANYAMKFANRDGRRPDETYDAEFEVMRQLLPCKHCVGAVAFERDPSTMQISALLMPLFDVSAGKFLAARLKHEQLSWFSAKDVTRWLLQVCKGLAYMHTAGYVHLDIKAPNVMMQTTGNGSNPRTLAIGDFGTALEVTKHDRLERRVGSPGHYAPEIAALPAAVGFLAKEDMYVESGSLFAADLYSFGIMTSVFVSGVSIGEKHGEHEYAPTTRRGAGSSVRPPKDGDSPAWDNLRGLISRCVADDPGDRPSSFSELVNQNLILCARDQVKADPIKCDAREPGKVRAPAARPEVAIGEDLAAQLSVKGREIERLSAENHQLRVALDETTALRVRVEELERQLEEAQRIVEMAADQSEQLEKRLASAGDTAVQWLCENQLEDVAARFAASLRAMNRSTLVSLTAPGLLSIFDGDQATAERVFDTIQRL